MRRHRSEPAPTNYRFTAHQKGNKRDQWSEPRGSKPLPWRASAPDGARSTSVATTSIAEEAPRSHHPRIRCNRAQCEVNKQKQKTKSSVRT
jgi:hypothetical protein